jgi:hypothetical protein
MPERREPIVVTVTYNATGTPAVLVTPRVIHVDGGQTIRFQRAGNMAGTLRITFQDQNLFDLDGKEFAADGALVRVKTKPPHRTTYVCELLDGNGRLIARGVDEEGGAIEPVKG